MFLVLWSCSRDIYKISSWNEAKARLWAHNVRSDLLLGIRIWLSRESGNHSGLWKSVNRFSRQLHHHHRVQLHLPGLERWAASRSDHHKHGQTRVFPKRFWSNSKNYFKMSFIWGTEMDWQCLTLQDLEISTSDCQIMCDARKTADY